MRISMGHCPYLPLKQHRHPNTSGNTLGLLYIVCRTKTVRVLYEKLRPFRLEAASTKIVSWAMPIILW